MVCSFGQKSGPVKTFDLYEVILYCASSIIQLRMIL
jgi:hypothetical protein